MPLYGRFGDEIELTREATIDEVLKDWGVKPTAKSRAAQEERTRAKDRCDYGMMWWGRFKNGTIDTEERIFELAFCRADGGFAEIDDVRRKLMGETRYHEAVGKPIPSGKERM